MNTKNHKSQQKNNPEAAIEFAKMLGDDWGQHFYALVGSSMEPLFVGGTDVLEISDNNDEIIEWLNTHHELKHNIYYALNPLVAGARGTRAAKDKVSKLSWIHADIDPRDFKNRPKIGNTQDTVTPAEYLLSEQNRIAALASDEALLKKKGLPGLPTLDIISGRGRQLLWKLRAASDLFEDGVQKIGRVEAAEEHNRGVEYLLTGATKTWDISRLLRLPGTVNFPDKKKLAQGVSPQGALASVVTYREGARYSLPEFPKIPKEGTEYATQKRAPAGKATGAGETVAKPRVRIKKQFIKDAPEEPADYNDDLAGLMDRWGVAQRTGERILFGGNEIDPREYDSRSENMFGICRELLRKGVEPKHVLWVITNPDFAISAHVLDPDKNKAHRGAVGYAQRQVTNALAANVAEAAAERERAEAMAGGGGGGCEAPSGGNGGSATPPGNGGPNPRGDLPTNPELPFLREEGKNGVPGRLIRCLYNYALAILKLNVRLSYDNFARRMIIEGFDGCGPEFDDISYDKLYVTIEMTFGLKPDDTDLRRVISVMAQRNAFHPVKDYLSGLTWDGTPRIDTWLIDHASAPDTLLVRSQSRLWLMAAVARILNPGAKFDQMPVLEGEQGIGKSGMISALVPNPDWYTDNVSLDDKSKEIIEQTSAKWIVEIGELEGMKKAGVAQVKTQLSRQVDRARASYGRYAADVPRQFVLIGTTNPDKYLEDDTGNRRFWSIAVTTANRKGVEGARDQLWAEAYHRVSEGETLILDPSLWMEAAREQEKRMLADAWEDMLEDFFDGRQGKIVGSEIYALLGFASMAQVKQNDQTRMGKVMRKLGFVRAQLRFAGRARMCFLRGDKLSAKTFCVRPANGTSPAYVTLEEDYVSAETLFEREARTERDAQAEQDVKDYRSRTGDGDEF